MGDGRMEMGYRIREEHNLEDRTFFRSSLSGFTLMFSLLSFLSSPFSPSPSPSKTSGNRLLILLFTMSVCFVISLISGVTGMEIIYTHLYYFPLVLAGLWYHMKAVYAAVFLGLTHVLTTYFFVPNPFVTDTLVRFSTLIVVAAAVGLISERHVKAEEELRVAQNFSENVTATVPDPLLVLDKNLRIKAVNHAFYEAFRANPISTIGCSIADIFGDKGEEVCAKLKEILGGKEQVDDIGIHYSSDRVGERVFNIKARGIRGTEEELVVIEDVTERKRAEDERTALIKQLEASYQELEQKNKELQELVFVASHHLQEPTRKIQTFGNMLSESCGHKLDTDGKENLEFIIGAATRTQTLLDDLRRYSRIIKREKRTKPVDLNELIADIKSIDLAPLLEYTQGTINVPEPLLPVQGDPTLVPILLQNLITNGLKYHRNGIAPYVTVRSMPVNGNMVRVEVQDNGVGIDDVYYKKIFELFQQLQFAEGTGIGLAICKKIVERHGGEIGVVSTLGEGSTFWFTMPGGKRGERRTEEGKMVERGKRELQDLEVFKRYKTGERGLPEVNRKIMGDKNDAFSLSLISLPLSSLLSHFSPLSSPFSILLHGVTKR